MQDRYCSNCRQTVTPTRGAFHLAYPAALAFTIAALVVAGNPPDLAWGVALCIVVDSLFIAIVNHQYPEGACPTCKTAAIQLSAV